jgi:predicted metalloprotease
MTRQESPTLRLVGESPRVRRHLWCALAVTGVGVVFLAACAGTTHDPSSGGPRQLVDVSAERLPVMGATDSPIDRLVRNAIADLETFWSEALPRFYGEEFRPPAGGYFSVDSSALNAQSYPPSGIGCPEHPLDPAAVAGNALYNPECDAIAYDRALLQDLAATYGDALPAVVLAHEFGHAVQGRVGFPPGGRSIQDETQADCFAGAWTAWVNDGEARHVAIDERDLDAVLRGYLLLRDPVGSDPDNSQAHGSYFDRVSAFSEGHDAGVPACRDDFGPDRIFTAETFDQDELANRGNAPYAETLRIVDETLPPFWRDVFPRGFGREFDEPRIRPLDRAPPPCAERGAEEPDLAFCETDETVYYDETELTRPAYQSLGDFAVVTAISLPYALAARSDLGLSVDDEAATRSAVCLTGWYSAQVFNGAFTDPAGVRTSPGDIDEAVTFLLTYGLSERVFPNVDASGFELLRAFRNGFLRGGGPCDVGLR